MKRFHVHLHVDDLAQSVAFYSRLFAAEPARIEKDYAKWMLDDPRINFAISTLGSARGVDHMGFQAETEEELAELKARGHAADAGLLEEGETVCCYAKSEKHWVADPQGIAWEHYRTLDKAEVYGKERAVAESAAACCGPAVAAVPLRLPSSAAKACCGASS